MLLISMPSTEAFLVAESKTGSSFAHLERCEPQAGIEACLTGVVLAQWVLAPARAQVIIGTNILPSNQIQHGA